MFDIFLRFHLFARSIAGHVHILQIERVNVCESEGKNDFSCRILKNVVAAHHEEVKDHKEEEKRDVDEE